MGLFFAWLDRWLCCFWLQCIGEKVRALYEDGFFYKGVIKEVEGKGKYTLKGMF
jgi:hypothetical protein